MASRDDERDGPKTPKRSGTWQRADERAEAARGFCGRLQKAADGAAAAAQDARAHTLQGMAWICIGFAIEFEAWKAGVDVTSAVRMRVSLDWLRFEKLTLRVLGDETVRTLPESLR